MEKLTVLLLVFCDPVRIQAGTIDDGLGQVDGLAVALRLVPASERMPVTGRNNIHVKLIQSAVRIGIGHRLGGHLVLSTP